MFFGGSIDVRKDHGQDCIVVDDWIVFRSSRRVARLVQVGFPYTGLSYNERCLEGPAVLKDRIVWGRKSYISI